MIYYKKKLVDDNTIIYQYGEEEDIYLGEIEVDRSNFKKPPICRYYVDGKVVEGPLDYVARTAMFGIATFIRTNEFPNEYLRAMY